MAGFGYADRVDNPRKQLLREVIQDYLADASVDTLRCDLGVIITEEREAMAERLEALNAPIEL